MLKGDNERATADIRFYLQQLREEKGHCLEEPALALLSHLEKHGKDEERFLLKMHLLSLIEEFAAYAYERLSA